MSHWHLGEPHLEIPTYWLSRAILFTIANFEPILGAFFFTNENNGLVTLENDFVARSLGSALDAALIISSSVPNVVTI